MRRWPESAVPSLLETTRLPAKITPCEQGCHEEHVKNASGPQLRGDAQPSDGMTDKPAIADTVSVLVVEDEFLIRETLAENLADAGFEVHRAGHSAEAIELLELRWDGIHVLFTDVNMPGAMDGIELAHHASRHWPKVALLVTSAVPHPKERVLPAGCRFIGKPYRTTQVVKHIRELARA